MKTAIITPESHSATNRLPPPHTSNVHRLVKTGSPKVFKIAYNRWNMLEWYILYLVALEGLARLILV